MPLTVGLLGAGPLADRRLAAYIEDGRVNAVTLAEPDTKLREMATARWGIIKVAHADFEAVIADKGVGLVDICVPCAARPALALRAIRAGKDAIVSVPPAATAAECDEVAAVARKARRQVHVCLVGLFHPHVVEARRLLEEKVIGAPLTASVDIGGPPDDPRAVGFLQTHGYRAVYLLEAFHGPARHVSYRPRKGHGTESGAVWLEMANGALASVAGTTGETEPRCEMRLSGSEGFLLLRDQPEDETPLIVGSGGMPTPGRAIAPLDLAGWATNRMIAHFLDCLLKDREPVVTLAQARSAVACIEAAARSAASGACISLG